MNMLARINGRVALPVLMLAIFAAMDAMAATYPFKAALMPLVVGLPGAALCVLQLVTELRRHAEESGKKADIGRELRMFAWFVGFVVCLLLFGFIYATPVLLYAYLRYDSREPRWLALLIAAGGVIVV